MRLEPLGETAWIVRKSSVKPAILARNLRQRGLNAVAAYETVGVYDVGRSDLESALAQPMDLSLAGRRQEIPVCYEMGEDLESAAAELGLSVSQLVEFHTSVDYEVAAIGFMPGFPYLGPLPPEISGLPRLAVPRTRVPAGSVAITGDQTGIYPQESPGGWHLIGRTPLTIVDVAANYFPIEAGDFVRFLAIDSAGFEIHRGSRL